MAAQFVDALKGYEYFVKKRGKVTRSQVNAYLERIKRRPISARTFTHYNNLITHGFLTYLPINKFDVHQALGKLQAAADRRTYARREASGLINLTKGTGVFVPGKVLNQSLVGFCVQTSRRFPVKREDPIWATMEGYHPIPLVVIWRDHVTKNKTRLGLRALEFIARYKIVHQEIENARLRGQLSLVRNKKGQIDWAELIRVHEQTNHVIEASEDLMVAVAEIAKKEIKPAKPKLIKIVFSSPGETQIQIDFGTEKILRSVVNVLKRLSLSVNQADLKITEDELAFANIRKAINFRAESRKGKFTDEIAATLAIPLMSAIDINTLPRGLFAPGTLERGILEERIIPALAELIVGDDRDFKIHISPDR